MKKNVVMGRAESRTNRELVSSRDTLIIPQRDFVPALDGLRGLAALIVLLFHVWLPGHENFYQRTIASLQSIDELLLRLVFVFFNGHIAVSLFFVLSGFVLALSLHRDNRLLLPKYAAFVGRRFLRIYPALFVNLLLTASCMWLLAIVGLGAGPTASQLGKNLILVDFQVNGATWTMLLEFLAVPLLLLGHLVWRKYGLSGFLILLAITIAICFSSGKIFRLLQVSSGLFAPTLFYIYMYIVDYQFMFLLGMLSAELHRRDVIRLSASMASIGLALSLIVMFGARFLFGYFSRWSILLEGIGCAGVVSFLAFDRRLIAHRLLEWRPIKFLGRISYSFYLYHATSLYIVFSLAPLILPSGIERQSIVGGLVMALLCIVMIVPMSFASFIWVERPTMRLGQRL